MIKIAAPFRIATETDAPELAKLVNFAGEGMPFHIWRGLARKGQDPWEIGRARQADKARDGQIVVVDFGEGAVASLTGYVIGPEPEPIGDDVPAMFRPLIELENQAPDSWYVNVLACFPDHRGKGLGSRLLALAERIARDEGLRRMSVIVAGNNTGARRLYERHGYVESGQRPCVKEDWETDMDHWVLLTKTLGPGA